MSKKIKLIIWDFDGVIADTEKLWVSAWHENLNKHFNLNWSFDDAYNICAGVSVKTKVERLKEIGINLSDEMIKENIDREISRINEMVLTQNIVDIFEDNSIKHCIATGGTFDKTMMKIDVLKLNKYFNKNNTFCADMVERGKPEPDLFLYATNKMGFKPEECIVIEDSIAGLTAAKKANINAIAFDEYHSDKENFLQKAIKLDVKYIAHNINNLKRILEKEYNIKNKIETFTKDETRFLSNFFPYKKDGKFDYKLSIFSDGFEFDCVENAYQAAKTDDIKLKEKISKMNPYDVVEMVKNGEIITKDGWDKEKIHAMRFLVWQKFKNHEELKEMLLNTGDMILEEGNTWGDTFWGICDGVGENNLGKILMKVREELVNKKEL